MRIDSGFTNFVAGNPTCTGSFASVPNPPSLNPGILFTGDGRAEFGKGDSSQKGWVVGGTNYPEVFKTTSSRLPSSYASILASVNRAGTTIKNLTSVCSNLNNCTLPSNLPIGAYRANNDVTLNGYNFPNNNNYIFLINGTLTLNGNISVPDTSTAFFSASDNIVVNSNVGSTPSCSAASNLEGFYSADNDVTIQGINDCTVSADNMLTIEGSVFVNAEINGGRFINNRNLCGNNYNFPSISFIERPDFILNIPGLLKRKGFIFSEEAP